MPSQDVNTNGNPFNTSKSWIDDLPPCQKSGIGFSMNKTYYSDGSLQEEHQFEDRSFHCHLDNCTYLYGIFDGHMGTRAADFGSQRMAAEILLGQLNEKKTDEEVKEIVRQAYISVERSYLDSINDLLAERASIQCDIPDGISAFDAYQKYPHMFEKLKTVNYELSSGTSALIALIHNNRLYVANLGNSRALLCRTDSNDVLRVLQLSVDHDLRNEDELLRLLQIGITKDLLKFGTRLGNQETTRCLGNYLVKGGYKEDEELKYALSEPVIAEPEICGGINLEESCKFLVLMSAGLYRSLEEVIPINDVNKYIAQLIVEQFRNQSSLKHVAQAVVDKCIKFHQERMLKSTDRNGSIIGKQEDITLIVRNLNYPLTNVINTGSSTNSSENYQNTFNSTSSYDASSTMADSNSNEEKRLKPYVDFSMYYINIKMKNNNL